MNMMEAFARSCNCYFYNLATFLDIEQIGRIAEILGVGTLTNIELPNEKRGYVLIVTYLSTSVSHKIYSFL